MIFWQLAVVVEQLEARNSARVMNQGSVARYQKVRDVLVKRFCSFFGVELPCLFSWLIC